MNKAKEVREMLGLTPTKAGQLLFGYKPKQAYDMWSGWEKGAREIPLSTAKYFDLILMLKLMEDLKTPGAHEALSRIVNVLSSS